MHEDRVEEVPSAQSGFAVPRGAGLGRTMFTVLMAQDSGGGS